MDTAEMKKCTAEEIEAAMRGDDYKHIAVLCENALGILDDPTIEQYIKTVVGEAKRALAQKQNAYAESLLIPLVRIADRLNSGMTNGYDFANAVEFALYANRSKDSVVWTGFSRLEIYYIYGYLLVEMNRIEQARKVFEKALKIAPASTMIYFEYAETFKQQGDFKTFAALTLQGMKFAYGKEQVARCLRNIGYCEIESGNLQLAAMYYYLSIEYDQQNITAFKELGYIFSMAKTTFPKPSDEEKERILDDVCRRAGLTKEQLPEKA